MLMGGCVPYCVQTEPRLDSAKNLKVVNSAFHLRGTPQCHKNYIIIGKILLGLKMNNAQVFLELYYLYTLPSYPGPFFTFHTFHKVMIQLKVKGNVREDDLSCDACAL